MSLSYFEANKRTGQFIFFMQLRSYKSSILKFAFSSIVDFITKNTAFIKSSGIFILFLAISIANYYRLKKQLSKTRLVI